MTQNLGLSSRKPRLKQQIQNLSEKVHSSPLGVCAEEEEMGKGTCQVSSWSRDTRWLWQLSSTCSVLQENLCGELGCSHTGSSTEQAVWGRG